MTPEIKSDHRKILEYALGRLFPMIDEFAEVNRLSVSVESGLLVLLAKRLVIKGAKPEAITALVREAVTMGFGDTADKSDKPVNPPGETEKTDDAPNIVAFRRRDPRD